ncbi:MAG: thioredoxin family protein [Deltaproteobacteria bacterium]|nr:thioredoxin family protein [Deltaproteobacteria bacterium]
MAEIRLVNIVKRYGKLEAVKNLNLDAEIEKVEDIQKIMDAGVMMTPAIVVDSEVKSAGKVLSVDEIKKILA